LVIIKPFALRAANVLKSKFEIIIYPYLLKYIFCGAQTIPTKGNLQNVHKNLGNDY